MLYAQAQWFISSWCLSLEEKESDAVRDKLRVGVRCKYVFFSLRRELEIAFQSAMNNLIIELRFKKTKIYVHAVSIGTRAICVPHIIELCSLSPGIPDPSI